MSLRIGSSNSILPNTQEFYAEQKFKQHFMVSVHTTCSYDSLVWAPEVHWLCRNHRALSPEVSATSQGSLPLPPQQVAWAFRKQKSGKRVICSQLLLWAIVPYFAVYNAHPRFLCASYMGLIYPWCVIIIPMYNAHPYFFLKTLGKIVHIVHLPKARDCKGLSTLLDLGEENTSS